MSDLIVTPLYAGILGLFYVALTGWVVYNRFRHKVSLLDGGIRAVTVAMRTHGNFAENVPLALLLLVLLESDGAAPWLLHGLGVSLLLGRALHVAGLARKPPNLYRIAGVALTALVIAIASLLLLGQALTHV